MKKPFRQFMEVGNSICDMHYGGRDPFRLPDAVDQDYFVERFVTFRHPSFWEWIDQEVRRQRPGGFTYLNKMLTVVQRENSKNILCAWSYDGVWAGLVQLAPVKFPDYYVLRRDNLNLYAADDRVDPNWVQESSAHRFHYPIRHHELARWLEVFENK